jgi:4-amino-4-deoxy-L-arabinose transferase-like glycosyltransferase
MRKLFHLKWLTAHWEWVMALLCLPVSFAFFNDFGLTWDSSAHVEYGERVLSYFLGGFSDLSSLEMGNIRDKGPLFVLLSALVHRLFGLEPLALWNMLIAAFAILTLSPLAGMGRLFGNQRVAFLSVLALLLMPRFVGHAFTNPKDIPFACMVCWSMFTIARFYWRERFYVRDMLGCAVAIGLALSMRAGGIFFIFLYVPYRGILAFTEGRGKGGNRSPENGPSVEHPHVNHFSPRMGNHGQFLAPCAPEPCAQSDPRHPGLKII